MTLDIIVPHYKEPWETCKYLFDTIGTQRSVPLELVRVIVVNDGDSTIEIPDYPYEIVYLVKEHEGVSAARNYGLDYSNADYVMFCDCDDGFVSNYGLHLIFSAMQEGTDYIYSNFIEETFDEGGNPTITNHNVDFTFVHGKAYRREFLVKHNLRFNPDLTIHEDAYFNMVSYVTAKNDGTTKHVDTPFYVWIWNKDSVVRRNRKDFVLKTYRDVMLSRFAICEDLKARGYEEDYIMAVCMTVMNSYYDFQKPSYRKAINEKYLRSAEKEFKAYWAKYKDVFNDCTNEKIAVVATAARTIARQNGLLLEQETLYEFLKRMS
jgi:glycosyltransferase involved in cell wall biosynthesis